MSTSPPNAAGHFKVNTDAQPQPGHNLWEFEGKAGQDPKVYEGSWGRMAFLNLFAPARGKGIMVPIACFGEMAEKVIREFKAGDWARARGRFHSYREKRKGPGEGMLKHQLYLCEIEHLNVDEASFRAQEVALLEDSSDPTQGLF
jgi:hypothetical protein